MKCYKDKDFYPINWIQTVTADGKLVTYVVERIDDMYESDFERSDEITIEEALSPLFDNKEIMEAIHRKVLRVTEELS